MAAITESRNKKTQKMTLRSSEFPDLKVEGYFQYEKDLRKKLNAMMRKRRAKSGGPTGKSPPEEKIKPVEKKNMSETEKLGAEQKQYPASTMPSPIKKEKVKKKKYTLAQLAKRPDLRKEVAEQAKKVAKPTKKVDIAKQVDLRQKKKKKEDRQVYVTKAKEVLPKGDPERQRITGEKKPKGYGIDTGERGLEDIISKGVEQSVLNSAIPEKPKKTDTTSLSSLPHIKKMQLAEIKRKKEASKSQLAPKTGPVLSKKSHPHLVAQDRKLAQEKEEASRLHASEFGGTSRDQRPPENVPDMRKEYVKKIKKLIADGKLDRDSPEAIRILGKVDPSPNEGIISNSDFADQLVTDAQIDDLEGQVFDDKTMTYRDAEEGEDGFKGKSKPLDIGPRSGLDQERVPKIQKLFEEKDPEAELIASEYEAQAAIKDAEERRELARKKAQDHRIVGPEPAPTTPTAPMAEGDLEEQESQAFQQSDAQAQENNEISQKIKKISEENFDHESNLPEIQKLTKKLSKEDTARVKEEAGDWYVDPWTGFAIDLNKLQKRQDRKDAMEMASLLPADKRAMYLYQQDLIEKDDLDKLIAPSEKEKLARKLTETQIAVQASKLLLSNKKLKNYQSPEQKEWYTSYRNAVTNDDMDGIYTFGRKLNLSEHELKKIVEGHKKAGLAKATKKDTDIFKKRFNIPYTKVWDSRQRVMMESAKVFEEGQAGGMMNFMGQRYAGRKGLLEDNGLFELEDLTKRSNEQINQFFVGLKDKSMFNAKRWQKEDGSHDYQKILTNPTAYNRLLQKNLIWNHMDTLGSGQYDKMEQYRLELQQRDESINQKLVSN